MMYIKKHQKIRIAGFMEESVVDGPGIRSVIFFQGCPHHCEGCQNPQTWDYEGGTMVEIRDIVERIAKNKLVSGVTFSGGEPMIQNMNRMYTLSLALKELNKNLWCYTGYRWSTLDTRYRRGTEPKNKAFRGFLRQLDVIVDGKFELENKSLTCLYRGSTNQRLICVQASLSAKKYICHWTPETPVEYYQHMVDSNYVCHKEIQARRHRKALQKGNAGNQ